MPPDSFKSSFRGSKQLPCFGNMKEFYICYSVNIWYYRYDVMRGMSIMNYDTGIRLLAMSGIALMLMAKQYRSGGWIGCLIIAVIASATMYFFVYKPSKKKESKNQGEQ